MDRFRALTNVGATVLVLHNSGKSPGSKKYRGSSDIEAAVDMAYAIRGFPRNGELHRLSLKYFKSRFAPGKSFDLEFKAGCGFSLVEGAAKKTKESPGELVERILLERPGQSLNGTEIKDLCNGTVGKEALDNYLKTRPRTRGKGKALLYTAQARGRLQMKSCLAPHRVRMSRITEVHHNPTTSRRGVTFSYSPQLRLWPRPSKSCHRRRNVPGARPCNNYHVRLFSTDMPSARCPIHKIPMVCPACRAAKAGSVRSAEKAAASRENREAGWKAPEETRSQGERSMTEDCPIKATPTDEGAESP